ncbi:MAG TPA: ferredoxin [Cerasibacillus sp.]|uniref:ferredoxin n=1 Tax=Cerasibacillus sp. TaxID=2498711 RepID=UPI002F3F9BAF
MSLFTIVDKGTCIACGVCGVACPLVFDYDLDGLSEVIIDENQGIKQIPESLQDDVMDAYESCPSASIKICKKPFNGNPNKYE